MLLFLQVVNFQPSAITPCDMCVRYTFVCNMVPRWFVSHYCREADSIYIHTHMHMHTHTFTSESIKAASSLLPSSHEFPNLNNGTLDRWGWHALSLVPVPEGRPSIFVLFTEASQMWSIYLLHLFYLRVDLRAEVLFNKPLAKINSEEGLLLTCLALPNRATAVNGIFRGVFQVTGNNWGWASKAINNQDRLFPSNLDLFLAPETLSVIFVKGNEMALERVSRQWFIRQELIFQSSS